MSMFTEAVEVVGAATTALSVYEQRKTVAELLSGLMRFLRNGRLRVAVLGPGGSGKTTLGQFLEEPLGGSESSVPGTYNISAVTEENSLDGVFLGKTIVGPGQPRRRLNQWPAIYQALAKGEICGVIYVTSWGYHSFDLDDYTQHPIYRSMQSERNGSTIDPDEFLGRYLEECRTEEVNVLRRELGPHLANAALNPLWMITLINKQDLWWARRAEVQQHYTHGDYNNVIQEIFATRGARHFDHDYLSTSLEISNFRPASGQPPLALTTAGYDEGLQYANTARLINRIRQLCGSVP